MAKIIIGLTGPLASGKGTVKKYVVERYQAKDCRFSTPLRDVLHRISIPESREHLSTLSTILRSAFGEDLLARMIAHDALSLDGDIVIVDGVRRLADIKHLSALPNFFLIKIDADSRLRFDRQVLRNENKGDAEKTYDEFMADHESEADRDIPTVMTSATLSIDNNGSRADLERQVDSLLTKLLDS